MEEMIPFEVARTLRAGGLLAIHVANDVFRVPRIAERIVLPENGGRVAHRLKEDVSAERLALIFGDGGHGVDTARTVMAHKVNQCPEDDTQE